VDYFGWILLALGDCTGDGRPPRRALDGQLRSSTKGSLLEAPFPSTRHWRVTDYGRKVMGTTMYLRAHHFPNVYAAVVHLTSSQETGKSPQENLSPFRPWGHSLREVDEAFRVL